MKVYLLNDKLKPYFAGLYDESLFLDSDSNMITIGAVEDDRPVGVLVASVFLAQIDIQWIYVDQRYRRRKIANGMYRALLKTLERCGCSRINLFFTAEAAGIANFLRDEGFTVQTNPGWYSCNTKLKDVNMLPVNAVRDCRLSSFMTTGKELLSRFNTDLSGGESLVGVPLLIDPRDFSPFSCCCIEDDRITNLILVQTSIENGVEKIELPWVYVKSNNISAVGAMVNASIRALKASFDPETELHFSSINPSINSIVTKIMPRATVKEIYFAFLNIK